ncbi:MAG: formamidopyrimidine-DNA glycosylase [Acidimicrobiaceae bacterium]
MHAVPEMLEVEVYRRHARAVLGRPVEKVIAPDRWILKHGLTPRVVRAALTGRTITADRRIGKLLLLDTDGGDGPTLGLRFGMTGRLLVDGRVPIEELEYGPKRSLAAWDRFALHFADGGSLVLNDPRRLGGVELAPDESHMGIDAWTITPAQLTTVLARSTAPVKARLMDQDRIAGLGNLLTDESLFRAGIDPARPAGSLTPTERRRLHRQVRATIDLLFARGCSHMGDLQIARVRGGRCPRDGAALDRRTIGGRTTYSCPRHQN